MKKWAQRLLITLGLGLTLAVSSGTAYAATLPTDPFDGIPCTDKQVAKSTVCQTSNKGTDPLSTTGGVIHQVTQLVAIIAGSVAVIVIVVAGISYISANGDAEKIKKSKNAIIYSLVGLIVIIVGQALINFGIRKV